MKAIQTRYKGYHFRSRLEARWAVFFDALGLQWEYEPEGFDLGDGMLYLPDFRVHYPGEDRRWLWFEVKGDPLEVTPDEWRRMLVFSRSRALYLLDGTPGPYPYVSVYDWLVPSMANDGMDEFIAIRRAQQLALFGSEEAEKAAREDFDRWLNVHDAAMNWAVEYFERRAYAAPRPRTPCLDPNKRLGWFLWSKGARLEFGMNGGILRGQGDPVHFGRALRAARSARFEHGESPRVPQ